MELVKIVRTGRIALVSFDSGKPANALSYQMMRELTDAAKNFDDDHETSAIVLTGRADNFSMGFDLRDPQTVALEKATMAERRLALQTGARMCQAWEDLQPLTISAIEGWCIGGGVALSVATDLRLIGAGSRLYVPEVERGFNMSWGSVPRITNLVGPARAKRIIVLAEKLSAQRTVDWGLADETSPDGTVQKAAMAMAERAASMPPVALRMCKQGINAYANALAHVASHSDYDQFALAQASGDAREGIEAMFAKRTPRFTGD
ncbi:MAG: enoyl-CoA hydratase/isomerase family protein [Rhodobacteraceae bacterium]|nr:enoyl-CoA hydratase/isomerase family protein [Paracoccaceae bacterium]